MRQQYEGWQADRAARQRRDWHGYIDVGGVNTWNVRLAEPPKASGAVVTAEITKPDGTPDEQMASGMRIVIERDGFLARAPTVASWSS